MRCLNLLAASLLLTACGEGMIDDLDTGLPFLPGEEVGRLISPHSPPNNLWAPRVVWSADGLELLYVDSGVRAVNVQTGALRSVTSGLFQYQVIRRTADGTLFFSAREGNDLPHAIYRIGAGTPAPERLVEGTHDRFAVSDDGGRLAYTKQDSLLVLDLHTGETRMITTERHFGLLFSPDGSELLHGWEGSDVSLILRITSLVSGQSRNAFSREAGDQGNLGDVRWTEQGVQVLFYGSRAVSVRNVATGATHRLWELPAGYAGSAREYPVWSADGTRVAVWVARTCAWDTGCQAALHLIDAATGSDQRIGHTMTHQPIGDMETMPTRRPVFSPDVRRLALPLSQLYVKDLP
jgi:hypothetical protein